MDYAHVLVDLASKWKTWQKSIHRINWRLPWNVECLQTWVMDFQRSLMRWSRQVFNPCAAEVIATIGRFRIQQRRRGREREKLVLRCEKGVCHVTEKHRTLWRIMSEKQHFETIRIVLALNSLFSCFVFVFSFFWNWCNVQSAAHQSQLFQVQVPLENFKIFHFWGLNGSFATWKIQIYFKMLCSWDVSFNWEKIKKCNKRFEIGHKDFPRNRALLAWKYCPKWMSWWFEGLPWWHGNLWAVHFEDKSLVSSHCTQF